MKTIFTTVEQLLPYLTRHWFKIGLVGMIIFVMLSKDLSFNIRVQAPVRQQETPTHQYQQTEDRDREVFTEQVAQQGTTDNLNFFSGFGRSRSATLVEKLNAVDREIIRDFVQRFLHVAEGEQEKFGIPVSIVLANAVLQSQAGTAGHVKQSSNVFALPCSNDWRGPTAENQQGCMRKYDNAWLSFRDHSMYITSGKYNALKQIGASNYRVWAQGLEEKEYLEINDLAEQLVSVIEQYQLFQLD